MANESQSRTARRNQMKASKKKKGKPLFKKILLTILIVGLVLMIGTGGLFAYYISSAPKLDESQLSTPFSSKVYDMNDNLVTDLAGAERRTKVTYDDLPPVLKDAVIATEDSRFYDHIGIDFRRIVAAVGANITSGFGAEGASTITQQVVKRSFLTSKKTIERKVQEQYLAIKLDQEYSKEKILEMYMNKIYYGAGAYGVAEAAKTYFGKEDLNELTLPQAALLAGLPQRPSAYNPLENPDLAKDRINTVLNLMVMHGKISEEEAEEARKTDVKDMLDKTETEKETPYDAFIKKVKEEVKAKMDGADIHRDGLKIYTTLDPKAQESVQELLSSDGPISWPDEEIQTGVAVTDTKTGAVRAIGGGRDYQGSNLNYATDITRQAGSTFKPIMAYGPAIQYNKISTYHQIKDEEYEVNGKDINNFDNRFRGWVSARYALSRSLNVPAIKTLQDVGMDQAVEFASGLGIDIVNPQPVEAYGGGATGVNPLQMAGAFATFGNEGVYNEPYTVRKIEVPGEDTLDTKPEPKSAMDSYTAYMISDMLQTTMSEGSGQAANISGLPEAGKTGTTNREDTAPDSWFNGYTTNYSISIWTGYNNMEKGLSDAGKNIPKQIFKPLMTQLSEGKETADFNKPESVVQVEVEEGSRPAKLPSSNTPQSRIVTELFHVDNQPSKVSKTFKQLDPVNSLTGQYNEGSNSIDLNWSYGDTEDVSFQVSVSIDGGDYRELTTTKDKSASVSNVQQGATYQFAVKAVSDSGEAESSESTGERVQVPGVQGNPLETPEEESPDEEPSTEEPSEEEEQAPEENNEDAPANEEDTPPEENTDEEPPSPEEGNEEGNENNQGDNGEEGNNQESENQGSENSGNNSENGDSEGSEDSNNEEAPEEPAPEQPNTDEQEPTEEAA
ncbi:penicillin-binding protein [Halobacillus halophilus]|uniref:Penicillin-binding proteins 1A/1B n=1 Tax=Halobacillus halophilus (strain ATCC 35676 / DSM 2266 / JCM 20832 / KCTC 3685 / LMG 17431 / NBRC 102448 / NCIMB 2269) TaxID=866895 RepID=I0JN72_HALH3|nr:penicillin-binding protein 1A [Halobacillus halophilus]ASF39655.1 penicillin-binding protein [Halobacillus halophilus]CCG45592.1 penicillin-binding proteins 1A/1B [Halobacillus halophilus DSM 2266]